MIDHSWLALIRKLVSTILLLLLAYALVHYTAANDDALFSDQATIVGLAIASPAILVFGVFLVQLLFVAPYQLWKEQRERADKAEASAIPTTEEAQAVADCTVDGVVDRARLRETMDRLTDPNREYNEAWADMAAKDKADRIYRDEVIRLTALSKAKATVGRQKGFGQMFGTDLATYMADQREKERLDRIAREAQERDLKYGPRK